MWVSVGDPFIRHMFMCACNGALNVDMDTNINPSELGFDMHREIAKLENAHI